MENKFFGELNLTYIDGRQWKVQQETKVKFGFQLATGERIIPKDDFITDFASIPRFFWRILPPAGDGGRSSYGGAAVIHDWLYYCGKRPKDECDWIFLQAMKSEGVSAWRANIMYKAVLWFGQSAWNSHRKAGHKG